MISVFLRGAWSCVKTGGLCDWLGLLYRLPVTHNARLWDLEEDAWTQEMTGTKSSETVIPYNEYSENWDVGGPEELGVYKRLLLVACRGEVAIDSTLLRLIEV